MNSKYEIDVINTFVSAKFTHAHFKEILEKLLENHNGDGNENIANPKI